LETQRPAFRAYYDPYNRFLTNGCRCAQTPQTPSPTLTAVKGAKAAEKANPVKLSAYKTQWSH
jgi:hypothetical protein